MIYELALKIETGAIGPHCHAETKLRSVDGAPTQREQEVGLHLRRLLDQFPEPLNLAAVVDAMLQDPGALKGVALLRHHYPQLPVQVSVDDTLITDDQMIMQLARCGVIRQESQVPYEARSLDAVEREHIERTLEHFKGNKSRTAHLLGIERSTLDRKLKRWIAAPGSPAALPTGTELVGAKRA